MRSKYRETYYKCGDYLDVNIYPVYKQGRGGRRRKAKPTPETKQKLNEIASQNKLIRIANANFCYYDLKVELTYKPERNPLTDEDAARELRNFLRRVKRYRERNGMSELKYIAVTERGSLKGRYHHHLIMNDIPIKDLVALWGNGIVGTDVLQFDENGIASLARYMMKQARDFLGKKKYTRSNNLVDPQPVSRDSVSKRKVMELAENVECRTEYEKLHEGYFLSAAEVVFNDANGGIYIHARYYSKEAEWCRRQQKRTNRSRSSGGQSSQ
ncbi:MAG: hypothetical protein IKO47_08725 [Ruminococcus sp.]|nr:hypothetical protein [Ruminococcus sp.]